MTGPTGAIRLAIALLAAMLVLSGCGSSDLREFLADTYDLQNTSGDTSTYRSGDPVGTTVSKIVGKSNPAARNADGGSEYLRYDDDIVVVSAASGGSTVRIEDLDSRYRSGGYSYLGPGFSPGSPAAANGDGGPGDAK